MNTILSGFPKGLRCIGLSEERVYLDYLPSRGVSLQVDEVRMHLRVSEEDATTYVATRSNMGEVDLTVRISTTGIRSRERFITSMDIQSFLNHVEGTFTFALNRIPRG